MELILLIFIFGALGYILARSKYSKPIDDTAGKVANSGRDLTKKATKWGGDLIKREKKAPEVVDAKAVDAPPAETPPAEKQSSRRKGEGE
jgi:hypothetical protein